MPTVVSQFCFEEMDLLPELRLKNVLGRLEHQWTKWPSQPAGVGSFTWILLLYYFLCAYMTPLCHLCHILVPFPLLMSYCFPSIKMSQTLSISFNFQLLSPTIYSPLYIYNIFILIIYIYINYIYNILYRPLSLSVVSHVPSIFPSIFPTLNPRSWIGSWRRRRWRRRCTTARTPSWTIASNICRPWDAMGWPWENHRKTIGKWWFNGS